MLRGFSPGKFDLQVHGPIRSKGDRSVITRHRNDQVYTNLLKGLEVKQSLRHRELRKPFIENHDKRASPEHGHILQNPSDITDRHSERC